MPPGGDLNNPTDLYYRAHLYWRGEDYDGTVAGFYWLGQAMQSPIDVLEAEYETIENQIDVLSKTFLGLTVACARCHDHKFDPISTEDYYALVGYLQSSRREFAFIDPPEDTLETVGRIRALDREHRGPLVFGRTAERRMERALIAEYERTVLSARG